MSDLIAAGPALMFTPGDRPDLVAKALERADAVVIDLEDAIAPERKAAARAAAAELASDDRTGRLAIRINGPTTEWFADDLAAIAHLGSIPVIVPMAESARDVARAGDRPVIPLIETPLGVEAALELARVDTVTALMWGSEDLTASLRGLASRPGGRLSPVMEYARSHVLMAAAAAHRDAIDAVSPGYAADALDALAAESRAACVMGFDAKACIHPSQVAVIRRAFEPDEQELARALKLVRLAATEAGVFSFEGEMIDAPVIAHARRLVNRSR